MSRSATPATRNEGWRDVKRPKMTTSVKLPRGTANFLPNGRLQTVANGCGRLQTVADIKAASSEHTSTPRPPKCKTRTLRYAFGNQRYHGVPESLSKIFHQYSGIWPAPQQVGLGKGAQKKTAAGSPSSSTESACCTFTIPENEILVS